MKFSTCALAFIVVASASAFAPASFQRQKRALASSLFSTTEDVTSTISTSTPTVGANDTFETLKATPESAVLTMSRPVVEPMAVAMPMKTLDEAMEADDNAMSTTTISSSTTTTCAVDAIAPGRYNDKANSIAVPFLKRPDGLDGSHAGDYGFDPLGLAVNNDLYAMQESELRHARLAMLAVVGWPLSEMVAPEWMLQQNGCAPSVLNGFSPLSFISVTAIFGAIAFFEFNTSLRSTWDTPMGKQHADDMSLIWKYGVAGDYNFDPLNLYSSIGDSANARKGLRDVEIGHGRMAMLGITYFAAWEALTSHPIIENSIFFSPNLVLPLLVASYVAFVSIYEVKNDGQYLFQLEKTSEGDALLERVKMEANTVADISKDFAKIAGSLADSTVDMVNGAKESYSKVSDSYLEYATKNIRENKSAEE